MINGSVYWSMINRLISMVSTREIRIEICPA